MPGPRALGVIGGEEPERPKPNNPGDRNQPNVVVVAGKQGGVAAAVGRRFARCNASKASRRSRSAGPTSTTATPESVKTPKQPNQTNQNKQLQNLRDLTGILRPTKVEGEPVRSLNRRPSESLPQSQGRLLKCNEVSAFAPRRYLTVHNIYGGYCVLVERSLSVDDGVSVVNR